MSWYTSRVGEFPDGFELTNGMGVTRRYVPEEAASATGMMQPRDAVITVHHKRKEFDGMDIDGNTPRWRYVHEYEKVSAKVWPVATGERELLVEWEDGTLGVAKLHSIRMVTTS